MGVVVAGPHLKWAWLRLEPPLLMFLEITTGTTSLHDTEACSYADDTTIFVCYSYVNKVQYKLEADVRRFSKRFVDNHVKLNDAKSHFMLFENNSPGNLVNSGSSSIEKSDKEKILG